MELFYNKSENDVLLFYPSDGSNHVNKHQLGYLLLSFLDLDPRDVTRIIAEGYDVSRITSEEDYEIKRRKAIDTYSKLVQMHPYFSYNKSHFDETFKLAVGDYNLEKEITYGFNFKLQLVIEPNSQEYQTYNNDTVFVSNELDGDINFAEDSSRYSSNDIEYIPDDYDDSDEVLDFAAIQRSEPVDHNFRMSDRIYNLFSDEDIMRHFRDTILSTFLETYEKAREAIDFCFMPNIEFPGLDDLEPVQRFYVYQSRMVKFVNQYYPIKPQRHLIIDQLYEDYLLIFNNESIEDLIKRVRDKEPIEIEVQSGDPLSLCIYELKILATKNAKIKNCENCGKPFFVQTNHEMKYCDREFEDTGKTCKLIGPIIKIKEKRRKDPVAQEYAKAYSRFRSKMYKDLISQEVFERWKSWAVDLRDNTRIGMLKFDDFTSKLSIDNDENVIRAIENDLKEQGGK